MIEKFSVELYSVLDGARGIARADESASIEPQHLLLALLDRPECLAVQVLAMLDVDLDSLRQQLALLEAANELRPGDSPWISAGSTAVLRSAEFRGNDYVGSQHLLQGLVADGDNNKPKSHSGELLVEHGAGYDRIFTALKGLGEYEDERDNPRAIRELHPAATFILPPEEDVEHENVHLRLRAIEIGRHQLGVVHTRRYCTDAEYAGALELPLPDRSNAIRELYARMNRGDRRLAVTDDLGTEYHALEGTAGFDFDLGRDHWWRDEYQPVPPVNATSLLVSWNGHEINIALTQA
jgi:Clp amino terminal domain, pathogenicity island component